MDIELEVKICPECLVEHTGENERCDMCIMSDEIEAFEKGYDIHITSNIIKAFDI